MIKTLLCLVGILLSLVASAETGKYVGVWSGKLGSMSIVACFNGGDGYGYGSYYYKKFLKPIRLFTENSGTIWHESDEAGETGLWTLGEPNGGVILGEWSNPKTQKTLPLRLELLADKDSDVPACARDSYNLPLEKIPPKLEIGKPIQISGGHAYRKLRFAGQETVELIGVEAGLPKINSVLKPDRAVEGYFQQRREFLGRVGYPAVDDDTNRVDSWIGKLVTISFITSPAGFGAGSVGVEYRTWNVDSGEEVDLWGWFGLNRGELSPAFQKLLLGKNATDECISDIQYKSFSLAIDNNGFKLFHVGPSNDCPDSLDIPYSKAVKLMTPKGRQQFEAAIGR